MAEGSYEFEWDFNKVRQKANKINDLAERLLFFKEILKNYYQSNYVQDGEFEKNYIVEIKFLEDKISLLQMQNKDTRHKEIEPIKWNNDVKQLAYLFWKLKKENIIENKNLGMTLSKLFIDKELKKIVNTTFNKHFSDFENNNTFPGKANDIDTCINSIKEHYKKV